MKRINAKKVFLICVMVCGWTTFAAADVVAYWPFLTNGLNDVSGNNHTLTAVGVKFNGGAAVMDGQQTLFNTTANLNLSDYSALTAEYFIKTTSSSAAYMLLEVSEAASFAGGIMMLINNGVAGQLQGRYYTTGSYLSYREMTDTANVADGAWHHVAMVVDRTQAANSDRIRLYLDGQLQVSNEHTEAGSPVFRNGKLYIGSRANTNWEFAKYVGAIDDIRISGTALVPNQFLQKRTADAVAIAYWPFNCGEERSDLSGNGNTLASSGVIFSNGVAVLKGSAVKAFNTAADLSLSDYSALTMEYFIKTTSSSDTHMLLEVTGNAYDFEGGVMMLLNNVAAGKVEGRYYSAVWDSYRDVTDTANAADGAWHHVAMVVDRTQEDNIDRVRLYLDGQLQSTSEWDQPGSPVFKNGKLYIGSRANDTWFPKLSGELDDIRITGAALEPDEFIQTRSSPVAGLLIIIN